MSILGNAQTFGTVGSKGLILLQRYASVSDLPVAPSDQTLAIISETEVSGFLWSATQPSPTIEGFVWIYENTNSSTIFHLNNQQLDFYPAGAMQVQTVDGVLTWVSVPLHAFVNNAWKQVRYDILVDGVFIIGGSITTYGGGTYCVYDSNEKALRTYGTPGSAGYKGFCSINLSSNPIMYTNIIFKIKATDPGSDYRMIGYRSTNWTPPTTSTEHINTIIVNYLRPNGGNGVNVGGVATNTYTEITCNILSGSSNIAPLWSAMCNNASSSYIKNIYMI